MFTIEELDLLISAIQMYETIGIPSQIASQTMEQGEQVVMSELERLSAPMVEDCVLLRAKLIQLRRELQSAQLAGQLFKKEDSVH